MLSFKFFNYENFIFIDFIFLFYFKFSIIILNKNLLNSINDFFLFDIILLISTLLLLIFYLCYLMFFSSFKKVKMALIFNLYFFIIRNIYNFIYYLT